MQAPKKWIGSESVNLFQVVCDVLELLQYMKNQLATHTHLPGPTPSATDAQALLANAVKQQKFPVNWNL